MKNEGWTYLTNSRKWHYFRNERSICGKFMLLVSPSEGYQTGNEDSLDNCQKCKNVRRKEWTE